MSYEETIEDYDESRDLYVRFYVDELFTESEVMEIKKYLSSINSDEGFWIEEIPLPLKEKSLYPFGGIPKGGKVDSLMIHDREDYNLSIKIEGFYDLRHAKLIKESGNDL